MLFDFKSKKMSKHLIGIDSEVYILYEDKVLLNSRENKRIQTPFFSFLNDIHLLWTESQSFQVLKVLILFLVQKQQQKKQYFLSVSYSIISDSYIQIFPTGYFLASCIH